MGYQSGLGLGKNKQGMTNPVSLFANAGKCGLGLEVKQIPFNVEVGLHIKIKAWYKSYKQNPAF